MKKYFKLLIITLIAFLTFNSYVRAREVNIDELGKEIAKVNPNATFAYIVGNYAFTSSKSITLEDVMIASRSIALANFNDEYDFASDIKNDNVYKTMNIFKIRKSGSNWKSGDNLIGTKALDQAIRDNGGKINIDYIDYKYVAKDTVISFSTDTSAYTSDLDPKYQASALNLDSESKNVTGIAKINEGVKQAPEQTNYYFAYVLHVEGATADTTVSVPKTAKIVKTDLTQGNYVILMALNTSNENYYGVTVDKDGAKTHYNPVTYHLSFKNVQYQDYTKAEFTLDDNVSGYVKEEKENVTIKQTEKTIVLSNNLYKQYNINEFNSNKEAYYVSLVVPKKLESVKVTLNKQNSEDVKITTTDDKTTLLFHLTDAKLAACQNQDNDDCKFAIEIDEDGEGELYLPSTYYLDISKVTPKVVTKITSAKVVSKNDENSLIKALDNDQQIGGYLLKDNNFSYQLTTKETPQKVANVVTITDSMGQTTSYNGTDFHDSNNVEVNYAINNDAKKEITISVDLDGDGTKYDATELTIDYTGLYAGENAKTEYATYLTKTKSAISVTVHNLVDNAKQEYEKGDANRRLITDYQNGIQAYTFNMYGKPYLDGKEYEQLDGQIRYQYNVKSLIRKVTFADKTVATKEEWQFEFGGYSGIGVIELALMNKFESVSAALEVESLDYVSAAAKALLTDVTYYNVTVKDEDINTWVNNYYGYTLSNSNNGPFTLTIAVDKDGYIRYLTNLANTYSGKKGWEETTASSSKINRRIEIVLDKIGSTTVPGLAEMDLSTEKVTELENKWHEARGCKREGNYYVCKSN